MNEILKDLYSLKESMEFNLTETDEILELLDFITADIKDVEIIIKKVEKLVDKQQNQ